MCSNALKALLKVVVHSFASKGNSGKDPHQCVFALCSTDSGRSAPHRPREHQQELSFHTVYLAQIHEDKVENGEKEL